MKFLSLAVGFLLSAAISAAPAPAESAVPTPKINGVDISVETLADLFKWGLKSKGAPIDEEDETTVAKRQLYSANDIINNQCKDIVLIFARGTFEPGNMGWIVGGQFADRLKLLNIGRVAAQGVQPYDASVLGYLIGGEPKGIDSMTSLIQRAIRQCPNAKIFISGYSQGAQLTHKAAARLNLASEVPRVKGAVLFGDPMNGQRFPGSIQNNVRTFCRLGDLICTGLPLPIGPHLEYGGDANAAADFVTDVARRT